MDLLFNRSENLLPYKGEAYLDPVFFLKEESDRVFKTLLEEIPWKQEPIKIFGKEIMQPRLTAWYADKGKSYSYSGITMQGLQWTNALLEIKSQIEKKSGARFNSALLNLYRDGNDSMGWHRDNEKELGRNPIIGSVSFGVSRKFQLRDYQKKNNLISIELAHGSFLLMKGESQPNWEHRVPKTTRINSQRINITFRILK